MTALNPDGTKELHPAVNNGNEFRILSEVRWGKIHYYAQYRTKFLGISYWRNYREEYCGWGGCSSDTVYFTSVEEAKAKVCNYLHLKALTKQHKNKIVEHGSCS